jgi:hypothetical protein
MKLSNFNRSIVLILILLTSVVVVACAPLVAGQEKSALNQAKRAAIAAPKEAPAEVEQAGTDSGEVTVQKEAVEDVIESVGDLLSSPNADQETANIGGIELPLDDMLHGASNVDGTDVNDNANDANDNGDDDANDNGDDDANDNGDDDANDNDDDANDNDDDIDDDADDNDANENDDNDANGDDAMTKATMTTTLTIDDINNDEEG